MAREEDGRPRHQQIAADIRARVMSGDLAPGTRLQTTQQLMSRYNVTNQTVQRALSVLKGEGFLVGRAGVGVYVREERALAIEPASYLRPPAEGEPYPWMSEAVGRGRRGSVRLLEVANVRPPVEVARLWGERVSMRRLLLLLDQEPTELAWIYHPLEIAEGTPLAGRRKIPGGTARVLADLGIPPVEWVDRVTARLPTTEELQLLELPDDVPVLRTLRTVYTDDMRPVEMQVLVKGGHRYELAYRIPYHFKE
ncbi:GntR family transcriptional regulator [Nonomuraea sp. SBT364]|uniref:GntR family transcriptional regulator n=1 Tax=Nonomuraea sp. SBT364 TaxID=1580530 RepID=UPI00066E9928|nr:GntR family transcriptional regulator [Nonomuraea sp. SBT364]